MANEFVVRNGLISLNSASITGSINISGSSIVGSFIGSISVSGETLLGGITDQGSYNLQVGGNSYFSGSVGVSNAPSNTQAFNVNGTWVGNLFVIGGTVSGSTAGQDIILSNFGGNISGSTSATHSLVTNVRILAPVYVPTGGKVVDFSNLVVAPAMSGTAINDNYSAWFQGRVRISEKLIASGSTVGITPGAASGIGVSVSIKGSDLAGLITLNLGSSSSTGILASITFSSQFIKAPIVVFSPANSSASVVTNIYWSSSTLGFDISTSTTIAGTPTLQWSYIVIGQ